MTDSLSNDFQIPQFLKRNPTVASNLARERAAQAWCQPETSGIEMDARLAEAFATILDGVWTQPWLGNATTGQLLDELRARAEVGGTLNYKTVGGESIDTTPTVGAAIG